MNKKNDLDAFSDREIVMEFVMRVKGLKSWTGKKKDNDSKGIVVNKKELCEGEVLIDKPLMFCFDKDGKINNFLVGEPEVDLRSLEDAFKKVNKNIEIDQNYMAW